ncbi:hypothetical protein AB1Y20_010870 [Prymnesium parvum]|uniref:Cytosolic iron-sulfur protein assembly protein CIAO1 homolog n=1 Tax=Prymnesium parvum TaxID=97485 RepID=A0AB34IQX6_PRYPA
MADGADMVMDVAYDYWGKRVATCASDQMIRVFDGQTGEKLSEWKAHNGSIWRLAWMHPEFGVALASCSFDRKVCIWEEVADAEDSAAAGRAWKLQHEIQDARDSVVDIDFAPRHCGLRLVSCGEDRMVRVHEAPDVVDLSSWTLVSAFEADGGAASTSGRARASTPLCVAWCPSPSEPQMLVVGFSDGSVLLWAYDELHGRFSRAAAFDSSSSALSTPNPTTSHGSGNVKKGAEAVAHSDCVRDVSWAADAGRSYQLIATASRDQTVRVWTLQSVASAGTNGGAAAAGVAGRTWQARCCCELAHRSQVWRVEWNALGSMLASSEDDGTLRLFRLERSSAVWSQSSAVQLVAVAVE